MDLCSCPHGREPLLTEMVAIARSAPPSSPLLFFLCAPASQPLAASHFPYPSSTHQDALPQARPPCTPLRRRLCPERGMVRRDECRRGSWLHGGWGLGRSDRRHCLERRRGHLVGRLGRERRYLVGRLGGRGGDLLDRLSGRRGHLCHRLGRYLVRLCRRVGVGVGRRRQRCVQGDERRGGRGPDGNERARKRGRQGDERYRRGHRQGHCGCRRSRRRLGRRLALGLALPRRSRSGRRSRPWRRCDPCVELPSLVLPPPPSPHGPLSRHSPSRSATLSLPVSLACRGRRSRCCPRSQCKHRRSSRFGNSAVGSRGARPPSGFRSSCFFLPLVVDVARSLRLRPVLSSSRDSSTLAASAHEPARTLLDFKSWSSSSDTFPSRSTPPSPSVRKMQSLPPAPPRCIYPRHVPDDLILMIIKTCNDLAGARTSTLASLCRLSKGYRALAEALLYSHVHLCAYGGVRPGTALHTLLWYPRLRAAVRSVKLSLDDLALVKEPAIALLLGDLNNVESIEAYYPEFALRTLLSSPSVRVRLFKTWAWTNELAALTWAHPAAFSTLERLEVNHVLDAGAIGPRPFSSRFSLVVDDDLHASFFAPLTAPFAADLVSLRLPLWHDLARVNLGMFSRLGHLAFAVGPLRGAASYTSIFQAAVVALAMAHTLPSLKSFAISGTLLVMDPTRATIIDRFLPLRRHQVPPTSRDLLYAIPRQIQHLALVTIAFHPSDVVAYLLSPYRAPFLKTLRVGDEVGRGPGEVLRDNAGVSAALESAGIKVTTVE